MQVFLAKDAQNLFQAFVVDDATVNAQDLVRVYYDVNRNMGDPDEEDRMIEVYRDGTFAVFKGQGSNADGLAWEPLTTEDFVAAVGSPSTSQWAVEMAISTDDGLMSPSDPFAMMAEFVVDGDPIVWPAGANNADAAEWSPVENPPCS